MSDGNEIRGIFILIFIIQGVLFSIYYTIGVLLVLGLFFYFIFFMYKSKKMKKEELNNILSHRRY
jgi:Ca2+/Na+ antiporter